MTSRFWISRNIKVYYLILARLVPYKRIDLAVEACSRTGRRLVVIGDGSDRKRLMSLAGPSVTFLGRQPDNVVNRYASQCRALIFPGEEDFGMAPLEINAAGRPVVAYGSGGATETVIEGMNGILFREQTAESLIWALEKFEGIGMGSVGNQEKRAAVRHQRISGPPPGFPLPCVSCHARASPASPEGRMSSAQVELPIGEGSVVAENPRHGLRALIQSIAIRLRSSSYKPELESLQREC